MKTTRLFMSALAMAGAFAAGTAPVWAKHGVLSKVQAGQTNYRHLHFPAIREETLWWNSPVLKDATTGDIIHFYGPCDYGPHGKDAVWAQRLQYFRTQQRAQDG